MSIFSDLFPAQNRKAATVAFIRTFWQGITGSGIATTAAGYVLVVNHVVHVDWTDLGYAVGFVAVTGLLAGAKSGVNILVNGLPATYQSLAVAAVPTSPEVPSEPPVTTAGA